MKNFSRRELLSSLALSSAACLTGVGNTSDRPNPIGVSTYSFWGFQRDDLRDIGKCIDLAAKMGFDGVEILQIQMEDFSPAALQKIKRQAFMAGVDLMGFSTHQDFVDPDEIVRRRNVEQTITYIEQAYALGDSDAPNQHGALGDEQGF